MFFSYLGKELRRRKKQAIVVAMGLAVGIGLLMSVSAMAAGVTQAQSAVLHSLYGVGTDITITQTADPGEPPQGAFQVGGDGNDTGFRRDQVIASPGLRAFSESRLAQVRALEDVAGAAGGLNLTALHIKGKLPTFDASQGGGVVTAPNGPADSTSTSPGQIDVSSYSIAGVDTATTDVGPLSATQVTSGRGFTSADAHAAVAILDSAYATQEKLAVGDSFTIDGYPYRIVGLAGSSTQASTSDVYLPLARAQALAGMKGQVDTIYVRATSASRIAAAKAEIKDVVPSFSVTTASDLASQVTGSLSSASNLATTLGHWLSIAALVTAIALACLLTLSSVGRRTRELGTLKALGWRTRRVVVQVMGESVALGLLGGALGILLGLAGAWLIVQLAPSLSASISSGFGSAGPGGPPAGPNGPAATTSVALTAPVSAQLVAVAIGLSLLGGAIAGSFGGWRAARMRPADAMRRVT